MYDTEPLKFSIGSEHDRRILSLRLVPVKKGWLVCEMDFSDRPIDLQNKDIIRTLSTLVLCLQACIEFTRGYLDGD